MRMIRRIFFNLILTASIFCISYQFSFCQTTKKLKKGIFKAWIAPIDNSSNIRGYLIEIKDSLIVISNKTPLSINTNVDGEPSFSNIKIQNLNISNLKYIKFRKKGKLSKSILFGTLTGFAIGGISGLVEGDDENCGNSLFSGCRTGEEKAKARSILFASTGALIGGVFGSMKVYVPIFGDQETFKSQQEELQKYMLKY